MAQSLVPVNFVCSAQLESLASSVIQGMAEERQELKLLDDVAISIGIVRRETREVTTGSFGGSKQMYPASLVKLFYLTYACHLLETGRVRPTDEFRRAIRDMIVDSNNDATGLVLDTITDTTGGPQLEGRKLATWLKRRQAVNDWFRGLGYPDLIACQKTWNEGPYGRERQGYGENFRLRNSLSPDVCLRLMSEIQLDAIVGSQESEYMRSLMLRRIPNEFPDADEQAREFSGRLLPVGCLLWSKAGWVTHERHDVAFIRMPEGTECVLAIFTRNRTEDVGLIGEIAKRLLDRICEV